MIQGRGAPSMDSMETVRDWCGERRSNMAYSVSQLVKVPTVAPDEPKAYGLLTEMLTEVGLQVVVEAPHPELFKHPLHTPPFLLGKHEPRPNLRARLPVPSDKKAVLFSVHTDVVPAAGENAWSGHYDGTRVHGRGSADTKANIVMLVEALRCCQELELPLRCQPFVDLVTDEEAGGNGALSTLLHGCPAEEVIVLEPTSLRVHHGHRGCVSFVVRAVAKEGHIGSKAGHAGPIEQCFKVYQRLSRIEQEWLEQAANSSDFPSSPQPLRLNLSSIRADGWHGSAPADCIMTASLGFLPGRSQDSVRAEIEEAVREVADGSKSPYVEWHGIRNGAFLGRADGPVARRLRTAALRAGAPTAPPSAWHVSCDARLYVELANAETVIFGCGDLGVAHTSHESVDMDQISHGVAALVYFLTEPEASF